MILRKIRALVSCFLLLSAVYSFGTGNAVLGDIDKAERAYERRNYYGAIEYYKTALKSNPVFVDALSGLAKTYLKLQEFSEAYNYIEKARRIDKYAVDLLVLEGRILTALGRFDEAAADFNEVISREPNNTGARIGLAELYVAEGDILNAIDIYNSMLKYIPDDKRSLLSLIILLDKKERFKEADEYVSRILQLYPGDSSVQFIVAKHYLAEGRYGRVESHAAAAVALDPGNTDAVMLLTGIYIKGKRYGQAAQQLEDILKSSRNQPLLWYMLGETYRLSGNSDKALRCYSVGVGIDPEDEIIRIALEELLASETKPDDPLRKRYGEYHFKAGQVFEERNYLRKAREEYRRGLFVDPHSKKGWLLYAGLLKTEGYLNRYLFILQETAKNYDADSDLLDKIEIYESILDDTVASRWNINQFETEKQVFRIALFDNTDSDSSLYMNAGRYIGSYLKFLLSGNERVEVEVYHGKTGFSQAFNAARTDGSSYFILLGHEETQSTFSVSVDVSNSRTGTLMTSFSAFRTGNGRVSGALERVSGSLNAIIPLKGTILKRKFNTVLIDLGKSDGIRKGDVLSIVKPVRDLAVGDNFKYAVDEDDIVGEVTVNAADDLICEGTIKKRDFFDLVAPGDIIIRKDTGEKEEKKPDKEVQSKIPASEIYKTILTIP